METIVAYILIAATSAAAGAMASWVVTARVMGKKFNDAMRQMAMQQQQRPRVRKVVGGFSGSGSGTVEMPAGKPVQIAGFWRECA